MKGETLICRSYNSPWHRIVLHRTCGMNTAEFHLFPAFSLSKATQTAASGSSLRHQSGHLMVPLSQVNWTTGTCRRPAGSPGKGRDLTRAGRGPGEIHTRRKFHSFQASSSVPFQTSLKCSALAIFLSFQTVSQRVKPFCVTFSHEQQVVTIKFTFSVISSMLLTGSDN